MDIEIYIDNVKAMTLDELAAEMSKVHLELDDAAAEKAHLQKRFDILRKQILPEKMEEMGLESARIKGVGTLSLATDAYCTTPADARISLQEWLREHDAGDLIQETVNASTLKAYCKEQIGKGNEIPPMVKFTPYTYAKITGRKS